MSLEFHLIMLGIALAIEATMGYPPPVFRALRHPVVWIGSMIAGLDRRMNRETMPDRLRQLNGTLALAALLAASVLPAVWLQAVLLEHLPRLAAILLLAICASTLFAQRSLSAHVAAVAAALETEGLAAARRAVAHIVGRNPEALDEAGTARAAIESLAENFSDGVVAPAVWCAALGLPGIVFYKAVNTADSMIGHRTPRHRAFGWAAARLDDLVNLPASRIATLWIWLAAALHPAADARHSARAVWRDAGKHRSPNAGWPEAAMAGALGLRLAGPRVYGEITVEDHWMGDGRAAATATDILRALALYRIACAIQLAMIAAVAASIALA